MIDEVKYKWLFDDIQGLKEKIRFKDRIEYRVSGQLHNTVGPALIILGEDKHVNKYFLKDLEYTEEDWNVAIRPIKLNRLKKKIDSKKNK